MMLTTMGMNAIMLMVVHHPRIMMLVTMLLVLLMVQLLMQPKPRSSKCSQQTRHQQNDHSLTH